MPAFGDCSFSKEGYSAHLKIISENEIVGTISKAEKFLRAHR
jgi:hypothetical protein